MVETVYIRFARTLFKVVFKGLEVCVNEVSKEISDL